MLSDVVIGLEVHIQLTNLRTKLWCGCSSDYRGSEPNSHTCPICLGHPGTLPVLNRKAIDFAIALSLALGARIHPRMFFYRKNYYYPDMSKNFQISQYNKGGGVPFASGGEIVVKTGLGERVVTLDRLHLEGDPGRLVHQGSITTSPYTLVDYNRCGMALIEIVSNPDIKSPEEAREFLRQLKYIVHQCGVADLELDGAVRVDANISLKGTERTEVKNINSFKEVEQALKWEVMRHRKALEKNQTLVQETRHWNGRTTVSLRTKETEMDYRYFPEPDLVPVEIGEDWIKRVERSLPELPAPRIARFEEQYHLDKYKASTLVYQKEKADFFEKCAKMSREYEMIRNWIMEDITRRLKEEKMRLGESKLKPEAVVHLVELITSGDITGKIAKGYIPEMLEGKDPVDIKSSRGDQRISDPEHIRGVVLEVLAENPKIVEDTRKNPRAVEALIGRCMKKTRGQIDSNITREIIGEELARTKPD
ncbi:MAG: Asp-tRNA(Asn)/Glu-tRNA(Gln) amidotransferase subunit GatB [Promethearchaeota archaeon]